MSIDFILMVANVEKKLKRNKNYKKKSIRSQQKPQASVSITE